MGKVHEYNKDNLAIILLAAGPSSRMGQSKQKLLIDGKPLLTHSVETAIKSGVGKVIVVLGSEEESHRKMLNDFSVNVAVNARWKSGMGSSLKAGLSQVISNNTNTEAVVIMVCDQPLVTTNHINSLIQKYRITNAHLVASQYSNTLGVPALFHQSLFDDILNLDDDHGAKKIIQKHPAEIVDFPEGNIDLDTLDDYKTFIQYHAKKMS